MIYPPLAIQICTFNRTVEIRETITALHDHLHYPGPVQYVVCDDSTEGDYLDNIYREFKSALNIVCISTPQRSGWGANVNGGLGYIRNHLGIDYVYFTEDDYVLKQDIDLTLGVALLELNPAIGLVRYDGIAGHPLQAELLEFDISSRLPDFIHGEVWSLPGRLHYWNLLHGSNHLNLYSNRPHLKHSRFHDFYGIYIQGHKLAATEIEFAHRYRNHMQSPGAPRIVTFPENVLRKYADVGQSFQYTEHDQGAELK